MMERRRLAKHAFIILWVLWVMLCVRFNFRIGLIGFNGNAGDLSTVLFVGIFCVSIPVSLLFVKRENIQRLILSAVPLCLSGIAVLIWIDEVYIPIASALLSAGSALLTASFLYIYVYGLTKPEQTILILGFLIVKPIFSMLAIMISEIDATLYYVALAAAVIITIAVISRFIDIANCPSVKASTVVINAPVRTFTSVFILFALIVFERMNCAFTLFAQGTISSTPYYLYFAGGLTMALAAYWMFVHKKINVSVALDIFLFSVIVYFIISIAIQSGLLAFNSIGMAFFGISDIIYVFLFVTAASISSAYPNKKVFMGFVLIFSVGMICAFIFSYYLYMLNKKLYMIIYSLASLAMIGLCILMASLMRRVEKQITPESQKTKTLKFLNEQEMPDLMNSSSDTEITASLTVREKEIVSLYLKGYSNSQIYEMLHIAPATLKVHCRNIYEKLKIKNRLELHFLFQVNKEDGVH